MALERGGWTRLAPRTHGISSGQCPPPLKPPFKPPFKAAETQSVVLRIGITDYAQHTLGDVTFVRLPEVGATLAAGDVLEEVQSLKSDSEVYSPVAGKVAVVNGALSESPELVNDDPYGEGWICELESIGPEPDGGLMDPEAYTKVILRAQSVGAGGGKG
jgi:glycine cleavage system H protein